MSKFYQAPAGDVTWRGKKKHTDYAYALGDVVQLNSFIKHEDLLPQAMTHAMRSPEMMIQ